MTSGQHNVQFTLHKANFGPGELRLPSVGVVGAGFDAREQNASDSGWMLDPNNGELLHDRKSSVWAGMPEKELKADDVIVRSLHPVPS